MIIEELKDLLVQETSLVFGKDLFIGKLPQDKQNVVVMNTSPSPSIEYNFNDKYGYQVQNILFRIRGNEKENNTRQLAEEVMDALENISNVNLGSYRVIRGVFETPIHQIERDDNNNFIYVGFYSIMIEKGE